MKWITLIYSLSYLCRAIFTVFIYILCLYRKTIYIGTCTCMLQQMFNKTTVFTCILIIKVVCGPGWMERWEKGLGHSNASIHPGFFLSLSIYLNLRMV